MKTAFKKIIKISILFLIICIVLGLLVFGYYYIKISNKYGALVFDKDKLISATSYAEILDNNDNVISNASIDGRKTISIDQIPQHTLDAFIAIEDQNFYKHNGINYKRILKSLIVNIKSGYAKEGASTISQQLIKNTHLDNEKTFERKLKEFFLTKKLEKSFTKDEILETYLNVIYFGNSCFGIENASNFYFDKSTSDLDIAESAMLAGIIKSPKLYSPILNPQNCIKRRNLVLNQMQKCNFITKEQEENEMQKEILLSNNTLNNSIERTTLSYTAQKLNLDEKELINSNLKIKTYINKQIQSFIDNINLDIFRYDDNMPEYAIIVENNTNGGIEAIRTSSSVNIEDMHREPASCLKPFLVYAPNFEDGKINLLTKIDDSPIDINGFKPKNAGNKYKGKISIKEAISNSSNVCATKLLSYYGINKAKKFAEKFEFEFSKQDNHLALALGSLYNGCNLLTLINAYATIANAGAIPNVSFIDSIKGTNDLLLFKNEKSNKQVLSQETAFLITQALQNCSKYGTGKKLKDYSNFVATKTGTNGAQNSDKNTDAYCISYSKDYTVCVWMGVKNYDMPLMPQNYNGGNQPAIISKQIWKFLKPNKTFEIPQNIIQLNIDKINYEKNGTVKLATTDTQDRYIIKEYFNKKYAPTLYADTFNQNITPSIDVIVDKRNVKISFETKDNTTYYLHRIKDDVDSIIDTVTAKDKEYTYEDKDLQPNFYEYYVVAKKDSELKSKPIKVLIK